jgi:hypothetical protein
MIDRSRGRAPTHKRGLFAVRGVGLLRHAERAGFNVVGLMVRRAKLACSSR